MNDTPAPPRTLQDIAAALLQSPKGLLAADESNKSADKRFSALGIPSTPETHRQYRQLLLTTPNIDHYVSGVIFYEETLRQATDDGTPFPRYLANKNILSGIKVDKGLIPLDNFPDETITEGLDGLAERLEEYSKLGASFAKWRAAFKIGLGTPSKGALHANLHVMARYASICQSAGIVPIVEPEILYDGSHTLEQAQEATQEAISLLVAMLKAYRVDLTGTILKTSMVLAGKAHPPTPATEVAEATLKVLHAAVPQTVAGIVFLSGGQTTQQAIDNLPAIGAKGKQPWPITFSFSRAVQDMPMKTWAGQADNTATAQTAYYELTQNAAQARQGTYTPTSSHIPADDFVGATQDA